MRQVQAIAMEEQTTLKEVLNEILAIGLGRKTASTHAWVCKSYNMGTPSFDYAKAWAAVDSLEEDAVAEKIRLNK